MEHINEQIRNIKVAMQGMESNGDLSEANKIILELGLDLLKKLVQGQYDNCWCRANYGYRKKIEQ